VRLHLGCGDKILPGWTNVDVIARPGVDLVLDVREGLPFSDVELIFAEHFLEHLPLAGGIALLRSCRQSLASAGVLRLSTPNLDWVWATSYSSRWTATGPATAIIDAVRWEHGLASANDCLALNRAFRAWGHQFLYNFGMLARVLRMAGFADVRECAYGESGHAELSGLERHERYPDSPHLPHILIVEASGRSAEESERGLDAAIEEYQRDLRLS
jgi:predicted SAM-dependent methyltransferase